MRATLCLSLCVSASVGWAQSVRTVDFANRVWADTCLGSVRTHAGAFHRRGTDPGSNAFTVGASVFGDLDGDGRDEAVVTTRCEGGRAGHFGDATVFAWRGGGLREVARLGEGDHPVGALEAVRIERGVLVERRRADAEYVVTRRRALRDGRLVELGPATVACADPHAAGCVPPSGRPAEVRFEPGHTAATRMLTFDAQGRLPTLALWVLDGQDLDVDAWCEGTAPALLRVEAPGGPAVESDSAASWVRVHAARSGLYRVSLRAQAVVGLCYARLGVHALQSPR